MKKIWIYAFLLLSTFVSGDSYAQVDSLGWGTNYPAVPERMIAETKWRYTYAIHLESNTIIHQAEDFYDYFLHFRYDYTFEQYLNGQMTRGTWSLNGSELFYSFKHIKKFEIAGATKKTLMLEFTQANSKGTYQYHFIRVESKDAPFVKPSYELPEVLVERNDVRKLKDRFAFRKKKRKRKSRREKRANKKKPKKEPIFINIELIGGGYYGGIDPVLRDYIHIKSDGRLVKEYKGANTGLTITKRTIPRDELEQFAEFIIAQRFFEFDQIYDCDMAACEERKRGKPIPIPLRLVVAYGSRKKVVTVTIWGQDKHKIKYVDYPPALDNIVEAIQKMAHSLDANSMTKRN